LGFWRRARLTTLPAFNFPPGQRDSALPAEVADVVKVAAHEAGGAVGCHDWSYLSHSPNVGSMLGQALDLSTPKLATFLVAYGPKFLEHIELCDT